MMKSEEKKIFASEDVDFNTWMLASVGVIGIKKTREIMRTYFEIREEVKTMEETKDE